MKTVAVPSQETKTVYLNFSARDTSQKLMRTQGHIAYTTRQIAYFNRDTSFRCSPTPANTNRSSIIVFLQDQGLLIRKGGMPRGYGPANAETDGACSIFL